MKGGMIPSVSAGSSQREASLMCTPHVIVPSGAAAGRPVRPAMSRPSNATTRQHMVNALMPPPVFELLLEPDVLVGRSEVELGVQADRGLLDPRSHPVQRGGLEDRPEH